MTIHHGEGVEKSPDDKALVEGAWAGNFSDYNFYESSVFSGSGFAQVDEELLFSNSTDRISPIFSIHKDGCVYISNSAIFVMSLAGEQPHPLYPFYNHDVLRTYRAGLYDLAGKTRLAGGQTLFIHVSAIIAVTANGTIQYRTHPVGEEPDGFEHYHHLLKDGVAQLLANGRDPKRKFPLGSAAAISTGYDSCTTAVLARDGGCKVAHSFFDSRSDDPYADSGAKNAAMLGMECREYDRWSYLNSSYPVEAEFSLSSAASNPTIAVMEQDLRDNIYVIGAYGETPWGVKRMAYFDQLSNPWGRSISNISQVEYRLRIGYIIFAPALIAARHNTAIAKISKDPEMQRWSIDSVYNRPIARRICEEAGIPREQFGMNKFAGGHSSLKSDENFSDAGYASYEASLEKQKNETSSLLRLFWYTRFKITCFVYNSLLSSTRKSAHSNRLIRKFPFILNSPPQRYPWKFAFTFKWAFDELEQRYQIPSQGLTPKEDTTR